MDVTKPWWGLLVAGICAATLPACSGDSDGDGEGSSTETVGETETGAPSEASTSETASSGMTTEASTSGVAETGGTGDEGTSTGDEGSGMPVDLPVPSGACPVLADGDVVFAPAGIPERTVRIWMSDAAEERDGPLVFYWHGTGSNPGEANFGLGTSFVQAVVDAGGIVAAPTSDPNAGTFPWYLVVGQTEDDLLVADEILGCAIEQVGIDTTRIHAAGMSAGGLMTSQMSYRRSNYLASVVVYSGGFVSTSPPDADPMNAFAAMTFHGGPDDIVVISFQDATERYLQALQDTGRFGFICDHGQGHTIPQAQNSIAKFLSDHPYGVTPPYAGGLPDGFPEYCAL